MRKALSRIGCWKHRVTGASADWKHRERGFAIAGLDLETAIELGKQFDQNAIFAVEDELVTVIGCFDRLRHEMGRFSERLYQPADEPLCRIYVIRLDDAVLHVERFRKANPNHKPGKPCYYVGMTGLSPEERFAQHKAGYRDCPLVRDHGKHLARKKFESIPPLSQANAKLKEVEHAEKLRSQGYAIWQK